MDHSTIVNQNKKKKTLQSTTTNLLLICCLRMEKVLRIVKLNKKEAVDGSILNIKLATFQDDKFHGERGSSYREMKASICPSGELQRLWNAKTRETWRAIIKFVGQLGRFEPSSPSTKELHELDIGGSSSSPKPTLERTNELDWVRESEKISFWGFQICHFRFRFSYLSRFTNHWTRE